MDHVSRGAASPLVGFEDVARDKAALLRALSSKVVTQDELESALWSSNLLDELGYFNHPDDISFDQFVTQFVSTGYKFDKFFNLITEIKYV